MCERPGAALTVLEAKLLPCKKGGGSEPGPNPVALCSAAMCSFCGELPELHWSSVGALNLCRNARW